MKKLIIMAIFLIFYPVITAAEVKNKILYDNKVFDLQCNLLEPLYAKTGNSDWCNYGSIWEIKENTLYLLSIIDVSSSGHERTDTKKLFGDKYISGKVKAEWFSGELRIPDGKVFQQINNLCIFERYLAITVEDGKITKSLVFDNKKKKASTEKRSMLTPVINPDKNIFGLNYGTSEDEFKARFGQPVECRESGKTRKEMLYGRKYIFLFEETKLAGMCTISYENEVYQYIPTHDNFDNLEWKLGNGITENMNLAEVKKILDAEGVTISNLPVPAKSDNGQREFSNEDALKIYFLTDKARVEISLKRETERKNTDEAYKITEISVRLK